MTHLSNIYNLTLVYIEYLFQRFISEYKVTPDGKIKISINIPLNTLKRLEEARKLEKKTRSNWITQVILGKFSNKVREN